MEVTTAPAPPSVPGPPEGHAERRGRPSRLSPRGPRLLHLPRRLAPRQPPAPRPSAPSPRPPPAVPAAGALSGARGRYQGAKNMTKCAALWIPCVNMSAVYRCLACGSSSAPPSASGGPPAPGSCAQAPRRPPPPSPSSSGSSSAARASVRGSGGRRRPGRAGIAAGLGALSPRPPVPSAPPRRGRAPYRPRPSRALPPGRSRRPERRPGRGRVRRPPALPHGPGAPRRALRLPRPGQCPRRPEGGEHWRVGEAGQGRRGGQEQPPFTLASRRPRAFRPQEGSAAVSGM